MADAKSRKDGEQPAAPAAAGEGAKRTNLGIRLVPANNSEQPVVANYSTVHVAPGMVFVDFGFLEPAMLAAIPRVAQAGGKLPERVSGRLAVRVTMGYDTLSALHQQLGQVLSGLRAAAAKGRQER